MKFLRFDAKDQQHLTELLELFTHHADEIVEAFYSHLLKLEDDLEMTETYLDNFSSAEYEACAAQNGAEALKILKTSKPFDVLVADNYMPKMTEWIY
jgi:response regulator RpfG family c-di-GMP phosphodiesterase